MIHFCSCFFLFFLFFFFFLIACFYCYSFHALLFSCLHSMFLVFLFHASSPSFFLHDMFFFFLFHVTTIIITHWFLSMSEWIQPWFILTFHGCDSPFHLSDNWPLIHFFFSLFFLSSSRPSHWHLFILFFPACFGTQSEDGRIATHSRQFVSQNWSMR